MVTLENSLAPFPKLNVCVNCDLAIVLVGLHVRESLCMFVKDMCKNVPNSVIC